MNHLPTFGVSHSFLAALYSTEQQEELHRKLQALRLLGASSHPETAAVAQRAGPLDCKV